MKVKFKVVGKFQNAPALPDIHKVVRGEPFQLRCPKHSYMRGCLYQWGGNSHAVGIKHLKKNRNRVILPDGTLFFSAITKKDVNDFGCDDCGHVCIMDCRFGGTHKMVTSYKIRLNETEVNVTSFGPKIITLFEDKEVLLGSRYVRVTCAATGSPPPAYRWVKINTNDQVVDISKSSDTEFLDFNHTMILHNIDKKHNGSYACIATNDINHDMVKWKLTVRETPRWLPSGKITNKVVDVFSNFTWECKAYGDPKPNHTWYSNATQMQSQSERYEIDEGKLSFERVLVEDSGMYQCVAENDFGFIYQTVSLHVRARKPEFKEKNISAVFLRESQATLRCESNAIPQANYTWYKDDVPLPTGTKYNFQDEQLLVINKLTEDDAGVYKCIAENVFGKAEQVVRLTVEDISFIVNPSSNYSVNKGSSFSLLCKVKSSQEVQYKWRLNDQDLKYDDNHNWDESTNQLLIHNARENDSGRYECVAYISKSTHVQRKATANILVIGPPNILKGFHLTGECKNLTATLRWNIPSPTYNSSETVVILEMRTSYDKEEDWYRVPWKVNASEGLATVRNLSPWSKVQFRAITQNIYGDGPPCNPTQFDICETLPSRPTKCPENIVASRGGPGVLDIRWKAMTLVDINGPGFNYVVKYKRVKDLKWMKTLVGRTEEEFRIPNAGTNKLWYFTLQSNNSEGLGPVCLKSSSYSGQAKPGLISEVIIKDINMSSVLITWTPPESDLWDIDGYILEYSEVGSVTNRKRRSSCYDISSSPCLRRDLSQNRTEISGLRSLTQYNISLRAYNSQGNGPPRYSTFQTAPSVILSESGRSSPIHKRNWFITVISLIILLMFIVLFIIFVLNIRRSDRYLVRKREKERGGFLHLYDSRIYDPDPYRYSNERNFPWPDGTRKTPEPRYVSNGSNLAAGDELSLALSAEDKYDDDGSFVGEYSDAKSTKKYEEMFV